MRGETNKNKYHSEFPFQKRPQKQFKYDQSDSTFPEVIEEDKAEAENQVSDPILSFTNLCFCGLQPKYERKNRFSEIVDYNEFGLTGKRYKSEEGRK